MDGQRLNPLSTDDLNYFEAKFFLVPGTGTVYVDSKLSVIRQREVRDGFREELRVLNHDDKPVELRIRLDVGSDFADLFEVKDALGKKGSYYRRLGDDHLVLGYERGTFRRETTISTTAPAHIGDEGFELPRHGGAARGVDDRTSRGPGDAAGRRRAAAAARAGRSAPGRACSRT